MRPFALAAFTAGVLLSLAGAATAQQQNGPTQNMPAMDHANMQGMQGMDHSKIPMNMRGMDHSNMPGMRGNRQAGQGTWTPAPTRSARPGAAPQ